MVRAWYMDTLEDDQRKEHHRNPPEFLDIGQLYKSTGVLHWKLDADSPENDPKLAEIRKERGYSYSDVLECSPEKLDNYCDKLKIFFKEHIHADEEIRFVLDGSGYFDVRDIKDNWVRVYVEKGDLIVLPAGIYHRFTLDEKDYIKAMRLFIGEPVWIAINRPADDHPARKQYVDQALTLEAH